MSREDDAQVAQVLAIANSTREACAREVEAAGCLCLWLRAGMIHEREYPPPYQFSSSAIIAPGDSVKSHDRSCPIALAAKLREGAWA